jgi:hypothetical protein
MARQHCFTARRRRRIIGLATAARVFLALAMLPLATAPGTKGVDGADGADGAGRCFAYPASAP